MDETKPNPSHKVSFGTRDRTVLVIFDPPPAGPVLILTPNQARVWAKTLTRYATLAERIPVKPKEPK